MTYVFSHVNFYGQTETCYGEQVMCRAKILLRRCSMMLPVVRKLMGITVLVVDIVFMMFVFLSFRDDAAIHLGQPSRSTLQREVNSSIGLVI